MPHPDRRRFLALFSGLGVGSTLFPEELWRQSRIHPSGQITKQMIQAAARVAGLDLTDAECAQMLDGLQQQLSRYDDLRKVEIGNAVPSALRFSSILPGMTFDTTRKPFRLRQLPPLSRPSNLDELAHWPLTHLAQVVQSRQVRSLELTDMYLARLERYNSVLKCVVTVTTELARQQARRADAEIASGRYRGPLHGIPWGAKDVLATRGYPTTWGAALYKDRVIDQDATVVRRLEEAGAILVAKLSTGELAYDDVWFGGQTKNPWNLDEGSGGSSAGPAAATAAGLVGFALGTETGGSIVEPAARCGVVGLRPTFGRVSRHGAMTVAWSLDKIGPLCRTVEDCAVVLDAIQGPDGFDASALDLPFNWDSPPDPRTVRVGYVRGAFDNAERGSDARTNDRATLDQLRALGFQLIPIDLPAFPIESASLLFFAESSAAFDEFIRTRKDRTLERHGKEDIGNTYRKARFIPAVEYIQACRVRTLIMEAMMRVMSEVDVYLAPASGGPGATRIGELNTQLTNLTGQPAVTVPNGFTRTGMPTSVTFIGGVCGEGTMLMVAHQYQDATAFHLRHPVLQE